VNWGLAISDLRPHRLRVKDVSDGDRVRYSLKRRVNLGPDSCGRQARIGFVFVLRVLDLACRSVLSEDSCDCLESTYPKNPVDISWLWC
jgi:hypothetical protein